MLFKRLVFWAMVRAIVFMVFSVAVLHDLEVALALWIACTIIHVQCNLEPLEDMTSLRDETENWRRMGRAFDKEKA